MESVADKARKILTDLAKRGSFEDQIAQLEQDYRSDLGEENCPPTATSNEYEPGGDAWVKWEFLNRLLFVRAAIDRGEAAQVFQLAFHLGALLERFDVISTYKMDIIRGGKLDQALRGSRERANAERAVEAAERHAEWQRFAEREWASSPYLSSPAVARIIKAKHEISAAISTIRQNIKKPDEAH